METMKTAAIAIRMVLSIVQRITGFLSGPSPRVWLYPEQGIYAGLPSTIRT